MLEFNATIPFEEGLHARPASELVNLIKNVASDVKIQKGETTVNPKSILGILTLGASHGDEIKVIVDGADEAAVAESLKGFFQI